MVPIVREMEGLIDVEFTLADDCKFDVLLDEDEARELVKRLQEAIDKF